jgi:EAL domain-containing protein (putative c-di-GMP-specific phosphodiesterase class I)
MDARTADDLVQAADIAMYEAKRLGKDRYEIFVPSLRERLRDEFGLESALRRAVADGGLGVMFQPRASALTGRLQGFEALARWEHPVLGQIPPARFIPMAEKHDLIDDIGCWVVEEVCRTLVQWRSSDKLLHPVSINISAKQLKTPRLRNHLIDCMRRYQIPAAQIELELTESTMIGNDPVIRRELKLLSEMGHKLMIDDFGTGYSSLAQLQHLRVDVLKIDASFVRNLSTGDEARLICRAMVQIGKTLGIDVVAEGVETRQQLEQLQRFGCDEVQGYLLAEPMRSDEAMALLDQRALFSVEAPALLPADIPPPTRMGGASTS